MDKSDTAGKVGTPTSPNSNRFCIYQFRDRPPQVIHCKAAVVWVLLSTVLFYCEALISLSIAVSHWQAAGEDLEVEDIEVDPPQENEVRIRILYTGICHTYADLLVPQNHI